MTVEQFGYIDGLSQDLIDNNKIPFKVFEVLRVLQNKGYQAFLVGGACRDLILNRPVKDWDITTSALPEQVINSFRHTVLTGLKHGTVTVVMDDMPIEVTTFRSDGDYSDNRRPDNVKFGVTVEEDVRRRDFTINGLLYDGENIIDYVGGLRDIWYKKIQCIGKAGDRFSEDSLRVMRAIRFACQLDFDIEKETYKRICRFSKDIVNISQERIRDELVKILLSNCPSHGINLMKEPMLLEFILPELCECINFDQHNPYHDKSVYDHILKVLDNTPCSLNLRLSALLHDIGKPHTFSMDEEGTGHFYLHHIKGAEIAETILKRLKFDNDTINNVSILVKEHMARYPKLREGSPKKLINRLGIHNINDFINLQIADIIGSKPPFNFSNVVDLQREINRILTEKEPLSLKDLAINGHDLIGLGLNQGERIGLLLNFMLELILEKPELNNREYLLKLAKERIASIDNFIVLD